MRIAEFGMRNDGIYQGSNYNRNGKYYTITIVLSSEWVFIYRSFRLSIL
jgi:hypothetical protein